MSLRALINPAWIRRAVLLLAWIVAGTASAAYPDKPIRLVVPFPAGGGADAIARSIVPRLSQILGQPVWIENRAGAGGNVGAEAVARAPADGYTLLYGTNGTHAINQSLYGNLRFDPVADFAPISRLTEIAPMLVVHPSLPVKNVAELIRYARANPGKLNFASAGNGTTSHLAGELFKTLAGIDIVHIPYRGGNAAMMDVIAGRTPLMIDVMPNALPQVRSGKLRGLAVATARRAASAPEFPTIAEAGLPGFALGAWDGILAPAGTPPAIIDQLNAAIRQALADPQVAAGLIARGAQPVPGSPAEFARHIQSESTLWAELVRSSGARNDH
ncbi:MAG: tripartite tricarboxylate transporter substrate binding protein [Burkholderiaceae bacterium]